MREVIRSRANSQIVHWAKLRRDVAYRRECRRLLVTGRRLVEELARKIPLEVLIIAEGKTLPEINVSEVIVCSESALAHATGLVHPDGYAAEVAMREFDLPASCHSLLVLDGVADPGNLGTLFRTALALGWDGIFLLPGSCDPYNDKAIRAGRAAQLFLPHRHGSWQELLALIDSKNFVPLVAAMDGVSVTEMTKPQHPMLILGNEGRGVVLPNGLFCQKVAVPMVQGVESLNVSSAASILMYALYSSEGNSGKR